MEDDGVKCSGLFAGNGKDRGLRFVRAYGLVKKMEAAIGHYRA